MMLGIASREKSTTKKRRGPPSGHGTGSNVNGQFYPLILLVTHVVLHTKYE